MDEYSPIRMLRRDLFSVALNFLQSKTLTEQEVAGGLKNCIEFFMDGADKTTVRDFCMAKLRTAERGV